jgi:hypothetical protein
MSNPQTGPKMNYQTGQPLSDRQVHHLQQIEDTVDLLYSVMHDAEGSAQPGEHQDHVFMSRRMSIAATHLEIATMMARKAALEAP